MTLYAFIPTRRPEHGVYPESDEQQAMDHFIVREFSSGLMGAMENEDGSSPNLVAILRTSPHEAPERAYSHAEPERLPAAADDMPRADLVHLYG